MNACLIGVILLLLIGAGVMSARLGCYKKQINHMLEEYVLPEDQGKVVMKLRKL